MKKITVSVDESGQATMTSLVSHFEPFVSTHAIASAALRVGLDVLTRDPDRLLEILRSGREVRW